MKSFCRRDAVHLGLLAALAPFARSMPLMAQESVALAIKGYDSVAYFTDGRPVRGLPEFSYEWDELLYYFSSAEHRDLFTADPVRYAPQFANFCTMALTRGELDDANPEYWLISDNKLYIFGKPYGAGFFQQDVAGNIAKANQNRPLIDGR